MRLLIALVTWAGIAAAAAGEQAPPSPMPPAAQQSVDRFEERRKKLLEECHAAIDKEQAKTVADLEKAVKDETKKGNLDAALAVRAEIQRLKAPALQDEADLIGNKDPNWFENVKTGEDWERVRGKVGTVLATAQFDTGVDLKEGQKLVILPHPSDTWSPMPSIPAVDYKGGYGVVGMVRGNQVMTLAWKIGDGKETAVSKSKIASGVGRLFLFPIDQNLNDNSGSIRVKLVPAD